MALSESLPLNTPPETNVTGVPLEQPGQAGPGLSAASIEAEPAGTKRFALNRETGGLRFALTQGAMYGWSHVGYLAEIAAGKFAQHEGMPTYAAVGAVALGTTLETLGMSYAATAGMGDFTIEPKNRVTRYIADHSALTPVWAVWSGAPSTVMYDKAFGRDVDLKRRLEHSVPYGMAVGAWTTPLPEYGLREVKAHPAQTAEIVGPLVLAAIGMKLRSKRHSKGYQGGHRKDSADTHS